MRAFAGGHLVGVTLLSFLLAGPARGQTIIYVDLEAEGENNGESWIDAHADLQVAIDPNRHTCTDVNECEVWVREGTYKPDGGTEDRDISFQMRDYVQIYGGFAGDETQRDQRDWIANETILSGDLEGDDVTPGFGNRGDNSYNVVWVEGTRRRYDPRLDGFTISGGNALFGEVLPEPGGGGIRFVGGFETGSAKIYNCTITDNEAEMSGGGIYLPFTGHDSEPWIVNCVISDNRADHGGGIAGKATGSPLVINCRILRNEALGGSGGGGGVYLQYDGKPVFQNCLIAENFISYQNISGAGMVVREGAGPSLINSTIADNLTAAGGKGGGLFVDSTSSADIDNTIFWNNSADQGSEIYVYGSTPDRVLVNYTDVLELDVVGDGVTLGDGNIEADPLFEVTGYSLLPESPCIDMGDNELVLDDATDVDGDGCDDVCDPEPEECCEPTPDLDLNERILGGPETVSECPLVDMGAYEYTIGCDGDKDCADLDGCTADVCREEDGLCENLCVEHLFGDIVPPFCPGLCPQPNTDDILCVLKDFEDGPTVNGCGNNVYSTDLAHCGGNGVIDTDDILFIIDAFGQVFNCPHYCTCDPCEKGASPRGGDGGSDGDRSGEAGGVLLIYLTTRSPVDGPYEDRFAEAVNVLTDWVAGQMNSAGRVMLAEQLQDPSLEFASPVAEAMVPQIVATLLEE